MINSVCIQWPVGRRSDTRITPTKERELEEIFYEMHDHSPYECVFDNDDNDDDDDDAHV